MPNIQFFNHVIKTKFSDVHLRVVRVADDNWGVDIAVDSDSGDYRLDSVVALSEDEPTAKDALLVAWATLSELAERADELIEILEVLGGVSDDETDE